MQLIMGLYERCPEENGFAGRSTLGIIIKNYFLSLSETNFLIV